MNNEIVKVESDLLNPRCTYCSCVIDIPYDLNYDIVKFRLDTYLGLTFKKYIYIYHDKDIKTNVNLLSNESIFKTPHFHLLLYLKKQTRVKSVLNTLSLILDLPLNVISVRVCHNCQLCLLYFLHSLDKRKYQYDYEDLVYNDFSFYTDCRCMDSDKFLANYIIDVCENNHYSYKSILLSQGVEFCLKYQKIIYMILKSSNSI